MVARCVLLGALALLGVARALALNETPSERTSAWATLITPDPNYQPLLCAPGHRLHSVPSNATWSLLDLIAECIITAVVRLETFGGVCLPNARRYPRVHASKMLKRHAARANTSSRGFGAERRPCPRTTSRSLTCPLRGTGEQTPAFGCPEPPLSTCALFWRANCSLAAVLSQRVSQAQRERHKLLLHHAQPGAQCFGATLSCKGALVCCEES